MADDCDEKDIELGEKALNRSLSKFVAGISQPEKSEFSVPSNNYVKNNRQPNPLDDGKEPYVADLSTSDAQYERYKNLMKSKYYNLQVNSTTMSGMAMDQAAKYRHPASFVSYSNIIEE